MGADFGRLGEQRGTWISLEPSLVEQLRNLQAARGDRSYGETIRWLMAATRAPEKNGAGSGLAAPARSTLCLTPSPRPGCFCRKGRGHDGRHRAWNRYGWSKEW